MLLFKKEVAEVVLSVHTRELVIVFATEFTRWFVLNAFLTLVTIARWVIASREPEVFT